MFKPFSKREKNTRPEHTEQTNEEVVNSKKGEEKVSEHITKYIIADPVTVKNGSYHYWDLCKQIPVTLDDGDVWHEAKQIPNSASLFEYLDSFKSWPTEFRQMQLVRTVMKYKLLDEYSIKDKKTDKGNSFLRNMHGYFLLGLCFVKMTTLYFI